MTPRAILLGLLGAAGICGFSYFNDAIMKQTHLVGNNMPISVYGGLILFMLLLNPLLFYISKRLAFTGRELAVVLALTLAACCIPGSGLMRTFTASLMMPHHYARTEPSWQEQKVLDLAPSFMLADVSEDESARLNGFVRGLSVGEKHIGMSEVPWGGWVLTLGFWLPLILLLWIAIVALSVVVHRQWATHEQLPYPIAQFANSLMPGQGEAKGGVFGNRLFWIGATLVFAIHINNYTFAWFPNRLVEIPLSFNFASLAPLFPNLDRGGAWMAWYPKLYFTVIAFAYFLATDVSLSLGLAPYLNCWVVGVLAAYGIDTGGGGYLTPNIQRILSFGAYFGALLVIVYTGRHYYANVFRQSLMLPSKEDVEKHAVWAGRVFLLATAAFAIGLAIAGLDWPLAVLYTLGVLCIFLVMSRIAAETGLFFIQAYWAPCAVMVGLLGGTALGPRAMVIMFMLTSVFLIDPRESLMPFMANSLKLLDLNGAKIGRTTAVCVLAIVLGLAVAIPATLYFQYDRGANLKDEWATRNVPKMGFDESVRVKQRLEAQGSLAEAESVSGLSRFAHMTTKPSLVVSFVIGVALVLTFTAARWRWPRWPLHPVLFLVWVSYPARCFSASLLIGWFIKVVVTKYGGESAYRKVRPLMFGLIAGEMTAGVVSSIIGAIYYLSTGNVPKQFGVMPG